MCEPHRKLQAVDHGKTDLDSQEFEFLIDYVDWEFGRGVRSETRKY